MIVTDEMSFRDVFHLSGLDDYKKLVMYYGYNNDKYEKTILDAKIGSFAGDGMIKKCDSIRNGMQLVADRASSPDFLHHLYSEEEMKADPVKNDVMLMYYPVNKKTDYIIICAGGGFKTVCSFGEGFPLAYHFNQLGYNCFMLNYRTRYYMENEPDGLMPKPIDDLARAVQYINDHADQFNVNKDRYVVTGSSAGSILSCMFCSDVVGYAKYGLAKPLAVFPNYGGGGSEVCHGEEILKRMFSDDYANRMADYDVLAHCDHFPPAYFIQCKDDPLVPYTGAVNMSEKLTKLGIPNVLELHDVGGHGFGAGDGMAAQGWPERAIAFFESVK